MKKNILTLLSVVAIFTVTNCAFAVVYNYKIYNPRENKAYYKANIITLGVDDKSYRFGFHIHGGDLCSFSLGATNLNEEGLRGGQCHWGGKVYGWREITPNTFKREIADIVEERKQQGMYYAFED